MMVGELSRALDLMQAALSIIDRSDAAFDAAAHLDLAINRLRLSIEAQSSEALQADGDSASNSDAASALCSAPEVTVHPAKPHLRQLHP